MNLTFYRSIKALLQKILVIDSIHFFSLGKLLSGLLYDYSGCALRYASKEGYKLLGVAVPPVVFSKFFVVPTLVADPTSIEQRSEPIKVDGVVPGGNGFLDKHGVFIKFGNSEELNHFSRQVGEKALLNPARNKNSARL